MKVKRESEVAHLCPTLSDPMDCRLPGSSVHGIFQARVLEWVAVASSVSYARRTLICLVTETLDGEGKNNQAFGGDQYNYNNKLAKMIMAWAKVVLVKFAESEFISSITKVIC